MVYLHASSNRDLLDSIATEQLSFSELLLLERLRGGRLHPRMGQAAALMHVTPAGASRIIDRLAHRGLIRREPDEQNYRARRILITDAGDAVIERLHAARLGQIIAFTDHLEPDERQQLQTTLDQLLKHDDIRAHRPPPLPA